MREFIGNTFYSYIMQYRDFLDMFLQRLVYRLEDNILPNDKRVPLNTSLFRR